MHSVLHDIMTCVVMDTRQDTLVQQISLREFLSAAVHDDEAVGRQPMCTNTFQAHSGRADV